MSKKRDPNKKKFSMYFNLKNPKDASDLAMLEFCRVQSQLTKGDSDEPMGMARFIRFMAVEFALRIQEAAQKEADEKSAVAETGMKVHNQENAVEGE